MNTYYCYIDVSSSANYYVYLISVHLDDGSEIYLSNGQQRDQKLEPEATDTFMFYTAEMEG